MPHVTIEIDQPTAEAIATMAAAGEPVRLRADLRRGGPEAAYVEAYADLATDNTLLVNLPGGGSVTLGLSESDEERPGTGLVLSITPQGMNMQEARSLRSPEGIEVLLH